MKMPLAGPLPNLLMAAPIASSFRPLNGLLLVARLDGPTPEIASALVDKALAAETNGLWGRAYFDLRNVPDQRRLLSGRPLAADRRARSAANWVSTWRWTPTPPTFPESYPMSHIAIYAGWYDGDVSGPFKLPDGRVHARGLCLSSAFLQRRNRCAAPAQPLVRPAAGQGRHLHHGLRLRTLPAIHAQYRRLSGGLRQRLHFWRGGVVGANRRCPGRPPSSATRLYQPFNKARWPNCTPTWPARGNPLIEWSV